MSAHVEHGSTYSNCFSGEPLQQGCSSPSSFKMHPHKFGRRFGLDTEQTTLTCGAHQDEGTDPEIFLTLLTLQDAFLDIFIHFSGNKCMDLDEKHHDQSMSDYNLMQILIKIWI